MKMSFVTYFEARASETVPASSGCSSKIGTEGGVSDVFATFSEGIAVVFDVSSLEDVGEIAELALFATSFIV